MAENSSKCESNSATLKNLNEKLSEYKVQGFDGITIGGDVDIEMEINGENSQFMAWSLGQEFAKLAAMLFDFSKSMGYPVDKMR